MEAERERGEQVERGWEAGNCAVVAVAAVDSPPPLEMKEGRGEIEEEEAEGMGRRRLGRRRKGRRRRRCRRRLRRRS